MKIKTISYSVEVQDGYKKKIFSAAATVDPEQYHDLEADRLKDFVEGCVRKFEDDKLDVNNFADEDTDEDLEGKDNDATEADDLAGSILMLRSESPDSAQKLLADLAMHLKTHGIAGTRITFTEFDEISTEPTF